MVKPTLSDLPSSRKYQPGDRILARVSVDLTSKQILNLQMALLKYAGSDVRLLIVNCLKTRILRGRRIDGKIAIETLVDPKDAPITGRDGPAVNLDCSVTDFRKDDRLIVSTPYDDDCVKKKIHETVKRWAGDDVEVIVDCGDFR